MGKERRQGFLYHRHSLGKNALPLGKVGSVTIRNGGRLIANYFTFLNTLGEIPFMRVKNLVMLHLALPAK